MTNDTAFPDGIRRVAIFGAGAVGGVLATRLGLAGIDVSVIDIGPHLAAIRNDGLRLRLNSGEELRTTPAAVAPGTDCGRQDLLILAVKAHVLPTIAPYLAPLLDQHTVILTVQNGIPWWYFQRTDGPYRDTRLRTLDPTGALADSIAPERLIGCVVYPAAAIVAPGVVELVNGNRFPVGELDGNVTGRAQAICNLFQQAGLKSRVLTDIRSEIWLKALGTLSLNPISALTHATLDQICSFDGTHRLAYTMMSEAEAVAHKLDIRFRHTIEERLAGAGAVGAHKTSMLQDVQSGQSLEIEALLGSIIEMASLVGIKTPTLKAIHACASLLNQVVNYTGAIGPIRSATMDEASKHFWDKSD